MARTPAKMDNTENIWRSLAKTSVSLEPNWSFKMRHILKYIWILPRNLSWSFLFKMIQQCLQLCREYPTPDVCVCIYIYIYILYTLYIYIHIIYIIHIYIYIYITYTYTRHMSIRCLMFTWPVTLLWALSLPLFLQRPAMIRIRSEDWPVGFLCFPAFWKVTVPRVADIETRLTSSFCWDGTRVVHQFSVLGRMVLFTDTECFCGFNSHLTLFLKHGDHTDGFLRYQSRPSV